MVSQSNYRQGREEKPQERLLLSAQQGASMTGVTISTWWEWAKTFPDFPKPIRISSRCTRWDKSEVNAWLETRRKK